MPSSSRARAAQIVVDAGGKVVGRTRLQKIAYLLELAGFETGFSFEYRHYGPYSEDLSEAMHAAIVFDLVSEDVHPAQWGGNYSIYESIDDVNASTDKRRIEYAKTLAESDALQLELAATAAFIYAEENINEPWDETKKRKPEKASVKNIEGAKKIFEKLLNFDTPRQLPSIV